MSAAAEREQVRSRARELLDALDAIETVAELSVSDSDALDAACAVAERLISAPRSRKSQPG